MPFLPRIRSGYRSVFHAARLQRDLDEELQSALEELTARYVERGMSPDIASRLARQELGRPDAIKEEVRSNGLGHRIDNAVGDVVYAVRRVRRAPAFSGLIVVILAVAIGAATAIFSVVNALLIAPLPYRDAHQLMFVWQDLTSVGYPRAPLSGPELQDLRDRSALFTGFGGIWANTVALTDGPEPEQLRVGLVTPDFFEILGADPLLGRTFTPDDDGLDGPAEILLSAALWKRRYGGDPGLPGKRILVNGRPATVVGVMPESFRLLLPTDSAIPDDQQAWLLLGRNAVKGPRQQQFLRVVGRLKPGVLLEEGKKEIADIARRVGREFVEYGPSGATFYALGLQADATREVRPALLALLGAVSLLLTIGCVNVAGLLVTRAAARHQDTAIRLAIGASRGRLFRQCLAEGLVLSLSGGLAGVLVAVWMLSGLIALRPNALSRIDLTQLDGRVLLFTTVTAVLWGVIFSLAPYSQVFRTNVKGVLHTGARSMGTRKGYRGRAGLVVAQIGISTILLITAGLLARGFYELRQVNLGFNDSNTLTFKVSLAGRRYQGPEHVGAFSRQLRERLAAIPGVTAVGAVSHLPYDTVPNWGTPYLPEHETDPTETGIADARAVTPGYFDAIGAELIEGRWFSEFDTSSSMPVAIIDSVLARRLWPEGGALGKRLKADPGTTGSPNVTVTVVGVVRHLRHREMTTDLREQMYFPATQSFRNPMAYVVRSATRDPDIAAEARSVMQQLDPTLPLYDVRPLAAYTSEARATRFFTLVIAIAFAGSALALALIGIYGVTTLAVAQRRGEFAVRLALGARHGQVAALVVKDGIALALVGAVAGGLVTVGVARLLRTQLYTISPADPSTYIGGLAAVLIAAALASAVPAYRAARSNPLDSLRTE